MLHLQLQLIVTFPALAIHDTPPRLLTYETPERGDTVSVE
jgi:hypothetical protein